MLITYTHAHAPSKAPTLASKGGRPGDGRNIPTLLMNFTLSTLSRSFQSFANWTHVCVSQSNGPFIIVAFPLPPSLTQLLLAWDATSCNARLIHTYGDGTTPPMATLPGKHLLRVLQLDFPSVLPRSAPCVPLIVRATTPTVEGKACVKKKKKKKKRVGEGEGKSEHDNTAQLIINVVFTFLICVLVKEHIIPLAVPPRQLLIQDHRSIRQSLPKTSCLLVC